MSGGTPDVHLIDGSDGVWARVRTIEVTIWPESMQDDINAGTWCLTVAYRGDDLWGVFRGCGSGGPCLGLDGSWSFGRPDDDDDDTWVRTYRFTHAAAMVLAHEWAPKMRVCGKTAAEVLALVLEDEAGRSVPDPPDFPQRSQVSDDCQWGHHGSCDGWRWCDGDRSLCACPRHQEPSAACWGDVSRVQVRP